MKSFTSWKDLEKYGINNLTGESCAYGLRFLCDLNEQGRTLMCDYFSLPFASAQFVKNWNQKVNGEEAVASILLPSTIFTHLCIFIAFHIEKAKVVAYHPVRQDQIYIATTDEEAGFLQAKADTYHVHVNMALRSEAPMQDGRNVHQFTGRVT